MDILFNDLSLHGQFNTVDDFPRALACIMAMRHLAQRHKRDIHGHMGMWQMPAVQGMALRVVVSERWTIDQRRVVLGWIDKGPYWDSPERRQHSEDQRMEAKGVAVTGHAIGEAAHRERQGSRCVVVSFTPSQWAEPMLEVSWHGRGPGSGDELIQVRNWCEPPGFEAALRDAEPPLQSWLELEACARDGLPALRFAGNCFTPLKPVPFASGSAENALRLLQILNRLGNETNAEGQRTAEWEGIYQMHFVGRHAPFSPSSRSEEQQMGQELTFPGPDGAPTLFSWHGKVSHPAGPLRFHFVWPPEGQGAIYVAYMGPKLTKR